MEVSMKMVVLALVVVFWLGLAHAAGEKGHGFLTRVHQDPDGKEAKYVLFIPYDYTGEKPYPLILFLHGLGESGADGHKQVEVGLGPAIKRQESTFPFITIFPQSQKRTWQAGSTDAKRALSILEEVQKQYRVDPQRIYLSGLSMGGYGTWSLAMAEPQRWAAMVPICGGGDARQAAKIKDIPCWCFHGAADKVVNVERSRAMIKALEASGGKPKYTEYPGVGHKSWDEAYATPDLFTWLSEQKRK
jgi:predicted peptidase